MNNLIDTEQLKNDISIVEVADRLGIKLNNQMQGECITGHKSEGGRCFSLNTKHNYYHCFHCNISGDIISLVRQVLNISFIESLGWLKEQFNVGNGNGHHAKQLDPANEKKKNELYNNDALYELIFQKGKELLYSDIGSESLNYLIKERGYIYDNLRTTEWIYFPVDNAIRKYLLSIHPESKDQILKLHLHGSSGDRFRLAFPYRNRDGLITGFVKRATEPDGYTWKDKSGEHFNIRYDSTKGLVKNDLFNLHNCKGYNKLILVEGYPDALYLPTLGLKNIVACGQAMLTKLHIEGLKAFNIEKITIAFDNDITGIANAQKAYDLLMSEHIQAVILDPKRYAPHKDPDEFIKINGLDAFNQLIESSHTEIVKDNVQIPVKPFNLTDYGNAERLVYFHGEDIRYCETMKTWFIWDNKRWKPDDCLEIERLAKDTVRRIYVEAGFADDEKQRKAIADHAKRSEAYNKCQAMVASTRSEPNVVIRPDDLDQDNFLLNCENGTIDLRTGELLPHRKSDNITKIIPVSYDKMAECPRWNQFLKEVFSDNKDIIRFVQYAVGYSLTGSIKEECIFICYGTGRNGKSKFLDTLEHIMGDYGKNVNPVTIQETKQQGGTANEDIARLKDCRFISTVETAEDKRLSESIIKKMTGDKIITARELYKSSFQFEQKYKLWMATNHKPIIKGTDNAIWDRINLIPFNVYFPPEKRDPDLLDKLIAESPGILNWALEGCLMWAGIGLNAVKSDDIKVANSDYRKEMDLIGAFIADKCLIQAGLLVTKQQLYDTYRAWCIDAGIEPMSKIRLGRKLKDSYNIKDSAGSDNIQELKGIGLLAK